MIEIKEGVITIDGQQTVDPNLIGNAMLDFAESLANHKESILLTKEMYECQKCQEFKDPDFPEVEIEDIELIDNSFVNREGKEWSALKLIEASKDIKPFRYPIAAIDMSWVPYNLKTLDDFLYHVKRINQAELKYPIILDDLGQIADGWHRIAKAILNNNTFILAKRMNTMPHPDSIKKNETDKKNITLD